MEQGLDIEKLKDQESGNFLPTFFTISMSVIFSHYVVCINCTSFDNQTREKLLLLNQPFGFEKL